MRIGTSEYATVGIPCECVCRVGLWFGLRCCDVGDGHVASDLADGEASEGGVVGIGGASDVDVSRVGAVAIREVGDEAVGEGVAVGWPHGGRG